MREILFRGKAVNREKGSHRTSYKNGDWVYGLITRLYDERFELLPAEMRDENGVSGIEIDYRTIGQYTGLTDKNGTKIFEGDIVNTSNSNCRIWYVDYKNTAFCVNQGNANYSCALDEFMQCSSVEVIGNIHDNPELFKGGAEQ